MIESEAGCTNIFRHFATELCSVSTAQVASTQGSCVLARRCTRAHRGGVKRWPHHARFGSQEIEVVNLALINQISTSTTQHQLPCALAWRCFVCIPYILALASRHYTFFSFFSLGTIGFYNCWFHWTRHLCLFSFIFFFQNPLCHGKKHCC